jgi:hypothetical protein
MSSSRDTSRVDRDQRESYLAGSVSVAENARRADGRLDCAGTANVLDPCRVNLFECWRAAVNALRTSASRSKRGAAVPLASVR